MTPEAALYRLMTWLSPAYPVGAYSYSHGLEWAVEQGLVRDRDTLVAWLAALLSHGGAWSDAVLLVHGHHAALTGDLAAWRELRELAQALPATAELAQEAAAQGEAFARASLAAWPLDDDRLPALLAPDADGRPPVYPLAVAAVAACHAVRLDLTLVACLQAFVSNLVSAAVRLVPLGQSDGQRAIAALADPVDRAARRALVTPLEDLGTCAPMVDWCSMRHETQYTRLFRS